ncbi:MAG: S-layer protein [Candidatus Micrarchaeota archaeon]
MKSISVKRIAAVAAGAAMIGAAFAGAVTPEGLGSYPFFSNGEPQVKIVVGANAAASDGVAAANIAAMVGNLAYTSRAIEVQGQDQLVCTGGAGSATCTLGDKSATLEITTPGVSASVAYEMKTYIEDYLDYDSPTDSTARQTAAIADFPSNTDSGKTGGVDFRAKRVTYSESPLAYGDYITSSAGNRYREEERYYAYSQAKWINSDKKVEATPPTLAYHIQFVDPVPYCTNIKTDGTCNSDSEKIENQRLKVRFLGEDWTIVDMELGAVNVTTPGAGNMIVLGKEIASMTLMQVGDSVTDPATNYSVKLISVSPFSTTTTQVRDAQFQVFDGSGNLVGTYRILDGQEALVTGPNIVIHVNKLFSGTGGVANADVSLYSKRLEIKGAGSLDTTTNINWQVSYETYNRYSIAGLVADSVKGIKLVRSTSVNYLKNAGDYLGYVDDPQAMKLIYNGPSTVEYDPLSITSFTSAQSFPHFSGDPQANSTAPGVNRADYGLILVSGRSNAFTVGGITTNRVWLSTDPTATGALVLFAQNPTTGFFVNTTLGALNGTGASFTYAYSGAPAAYFNLTNATTPITAADYNLYMYLSEPVTASDALGTTAGVPTFTTPYQGWFNITVNNANTTSINFVASGATPYALYYLNGTSYSNDVGYYSPRGSVVKAISTSNYAIDYAKTISYAQFLLQKGTVSGGANVVETTQSEGGEYDIGGGYKVKVKTISATATAEGEVSGATVSAESLAFLTPNPSSADSVVALNTATNPLVVLDTDPMAATTSKLIVVGGPFVNTIAAGVTGADAISTPGSTPVVKAVGDKILVAGYTAADTKAAADALIAYLASNRESLTSG